MKKRILPHVVTVLAIAAAPAFLSAADTYNSPSGSSNQDAGMAPNAAMQNNPGSMGNPSTPDTSQALPSDWTKAKGTVQAVDSVNREVKIQDEKGRLSRVTIDPGVVIKKDGKEVEFTELQAGDQITLTRRKTPSESNNKG